MNHLKKLLPTLTLLGVFAVVPLAGCEGQGPAQETGEEIDDTVEEFEDEFQDLEEEE